MAAVLRAASHWCPFRKSYPNVLVVQPGQDRNGDNDTGPLDRATQGRILAQRQVRAHLIVVRRIRSENLPQVRLTKDQQSVQAVPVGNLRSEILVVQSAENWHRQRATDSLNGTLDRRVLVQRQMRPSLVVIFLVRFEQMAEMPLAEHNNMVKTIPSDRTDQPLRISVLPWRPWRDRPIPYTHCSKPLDDDIAIDAIPIANDISRRLLPAVGLGQLTGNPMGGRACGHTQPQKLTAGMLPDQKTGQKPERGRPDREQ